MNKAINRIRLFFCTFSGEDDYIIRACKPSIQISFALIGLFVMLVFAGCWVSACSFMAALFEGSGKWLSIPVGILWALMVTYMYLLLLYTVSPTLLPVARKRRGKGKVKKLVAESVMEKPGSAFTSSFIFRIIFILLLAIIIAQPLNVLCLSAFADRSLSNYKTEYRINMVIVADSSLIRQEMQSQADFYQNISTKIDLDDSLIVARNTCLLNNKVADDKTFLVRSKMLLDSLSTWNKLPSRNNVKKCDSTRLILSQLLDSELKSDSIFISNIDSVFFNDKVLQSDFESYKIALKNTISKKVENYSRLEELLGKSNFYVKTIQILLSENPGSWIITIIVCGIFLLPVYWKFSIRNHGGFYEKKKHIENRMVHDNYNEFKRAYSLILEEKIRQYNRRTWKEVTRLLHRLGKFSPEKSLEFSQILKAEIMEESILKYEYWADPPFRTKRKRSDRNLFSEDDFLKKIYPGRP